MQIFKLHIRKSIGLILCLFSFLSTNAQTSSEETSTISLPGLLQVEEHNGTKDVSVSDYQVHLGLYGRRVAAYNVKVESGLYGVTIKATTYDFPEVQFPGRVLEIRIKDQKEIIKRVELPSTQGEWNQDIYTEFRLPGGEYTLSLLADDGMMSLDWINFDLIESTPVVNKSAGQKAATSVFSLPGLIQAEDNQNDAGIGDDYYANLTIGHSLSYDVDVQGGLYGITIKAKDIAGVQSSIAPYFIIETDTDNGNYYETLGTIGLPVNEEAWNQDIYTEITLPEGQYTLYFRLEGQTTLIDWINFDLITPASEHNVISLPGLLQVEDHDGTRDVDVRDYYVFFGSYGSSRVAGYNVDVQEEGVYRVRVNAKEYIYSSSHFADPLLKITLDSEDNYYSQGLARIDLPVTRKEWNQDIYTEVVLPKGKYTLYLAGYGKESQIDWVNFELIKSTNKSSQTTKIEKSLVYPNPFTAAFKVELKEEYQAESLEIINRNGKVVYTQKVDAADAQTEVRPQGLAEGDYVLRIHGKDGKVYTKRLLKVQ